VQRRHQKVIEESPSPVVDAALRERMGQAAVEAARACSYVGAGTVEFLWEPAGFYFLEMNTRLQVEHPVTELVTGIDLVEWQIRVANGQALPSASLEMKGHAMEARLYAEDPAQGFLPQTGTVLTWSPPSEARVDHGVRQGMTVSPHYDPMIAKIIVHGADREEARRKLALALRSTTLLGVKTNKAYLLRILEDEVFSAGKATTDFAVEPSARRDPFCAALVLFLEGARGLCEDASFIGWRSGGPLWSTIELDDGGTFQVTREGVSYVVRSDERSVAFEVAEHEDDLVLMIDGARRKIRYAIEESRVWLDDGSGATVFEDVTYRPATVAGGAGSGMLRAPLDGAVTRLFVAAGEAVSRGQLVLVLEAMKMEHRIVADVDGTVEALHVDAGVQVKTRQLLAEIRQQEQG
jgi:geranyl-CoA carboxylase alpha subunit